MATIFVTNTLDAGAGSLRQAILDANATVGADVIDFGGTSGTITLTSGQLTISDDLIIDGDTNGDNKADITLNGISGNRVFNIGAATNVDLLSLNFQNASTNVQGGVIYGSGFVSLDISDSTFSGISTTGDGGALRLSGGGTTSITDSLFTDNHAGGGGRGGAIYAGNGHVLNLTNTTVHGNTANLNGGGITVSNATLNLFNSTVTGNQTAVNVASTLRGGLAGYSSTINITNSVIAENTSGNAFTANDVYGVISNAANSFLGTVETINSYSGGGAAATDNGVTGTALLGALADNGGTVLTRAILGGSALIDAGDSALVPGGVSQDANGNARIVSGSVDIGAVEAQLVVTHLSDVDTVGATLAGDILDDGGLSLREAVAHAGAGDIITFANGLSGTITLDGGQLGLTQDITIDGDNTGDDKADITLEGISGSRVFYITGSTTDVGLLSLNFQNASTTISGGAIYGDGFSSLDISDSTFSGILTTGRGGAMYLKGGGTTNITDSLLTGIHSNGFGGAIYANDSHVLNLTNTTVHDNTSNNNGGGITIGNGTLNLFNSTITGNQADADGPSTNSGGGLENYSSTINITNSVIAGNTSGTAFTADDVIGVISNAANSFLGTVETINSYSGGGAAATDNGVTGTPLLGALADNGGTVLTRAILGGSALIDAGDSALVPGGVSQDANGNARIVSGSVDIGAVETQLVVTTALDTGLDNTIDGTLAADLADGGGLSLREAIGHAGAGDEINFAAALAGQTIVLSGNELALTQDITIDGDIDGDNKADIIIDGNGASRVFNITGGTTDVNLLSLTLTDGSTSGYGGAIYANTIANLNVTDTTILNNTASSGGGGIGTQNTQVTLNTVTLTGNHTNNRGGGASFGSFSTAVLTNTTVHDNSSDFVGGGIYNAGSSTLTLNNSNVTGNLADADGSSTSLAGGIFASGTETINNSVVAGNTSGGALVTPGDDDVFATITTATNSFIGTTETITNDLGGNLNGTGAPVLLGELLDNGGTVLTLSPLDGSALIGAGSNASIPADSQDIDGDGNTAEDLPLDSRGGLRIVGGTVDIGAVEQFEDETIRGTDGVNNILGGDGDDVLEGKGGADNIDGGAHGVNGDTVTYISSSGAVQVVLDGGPSTGNDAAGDVITNVENIIGSNFGDVLTGNGNANFIDGGLGNDTLNGLGGNDILVGDFNQDTLNGGDDDDDLDGGAGNDIIDGGAGIDTGRYDSFGGAVIINLNLTTAQNTGAAGIETISNVENLIGGIGNDRFTGKVQVSVLEGGGGSDSLFGLGGDDILRGGEGNDNAQGGNGLDTLIGGNGRDTLVGGAGIDTINGDAGKDVIRGGDDGDIIDGGADRDVLIGGDFTGGGFPGDGAADTFVFSEVSDSAFGGATRDIIRDFEQGLDVIDLSAIDAITGGSDDAFTFIGTSNFSGSAGELRAFSIGGNTTVRADVDGDGAADMEIFLNGTIAMTTGDFVL